MFNPLSRMTSTKRPHEYYSSPPSHQGDDKDNQENKDLPESFWYLTLPQLLAGSKSDKLEEEAKTFIAIEKAHQNFGSMLPGLEDLGPTIRSAIETFFPPGAVLLNAL